MVEQISLRLQNESGNWNNDQKFFGVLDIFGFEFVVDDQIEAEKGTATNGLDQYCINTCNECLQNLFVTVIFDLEQALYMDQLNGEKVTHFRRISKDDRE